MKTRKKSDVTEIIIHCFDLSWGTEKECNKWHKRRGFKETGYHFIILNGQVSPDEYLSILDGQITPARPLQYAGAHCRGHNDNSIGIALVGKDLFRVASINSLVALCDFLDKHYDKKLKLTNHYTYSKSKTCPNFDAAQKVKDVRCFRKMKPYPLNGDLKKLFELLKARVEVIEKKIVL